MRIAVWTSPLDGRPLMNHRTLRGTLNALGLPNRFSVNQLAEALASKRGRPLRLRSAAFPVAGLSGGLLVTREIDFIAYQSLTSKIHQDHIVCHEFGHLIAGHQPHVVTGADALRLIAPNIDPSVVQRILKRSCSLTEEEIEAENIADLLMSHHIISASHEEWVMTTEAEIQSLLAALGTGDW
ncbi:hypothetical protein [Nocardia suismassiliense]|uniref:hypothetical protein n=1 Tax=Nocardia suismassiliense TaxID=2077092 RepID=UPI00131F2079|nr:hypothetical protein [Nocardia suismassiliense]